MNSLAWIGIIVWGLIVTGFGLLSAAPLEQAADVAPHDVFLLVSGGLLTCLIGIVGLLGFMGWIPGLQNAGLQNAGLQNAGLQSAGLQSEQKSRA